MKYTLQNEILTVVCDSLGGQLTSITNKAGLEYLWQGDEDYWAGQAPILFPICGSLRNNQAVNNHQEAIQMPRHGLVRKRKFVCEKQTQTEIVFSLTSDQEMFSQYPYHFKLYIRYYLGGDSIYVQYIVSNRSERNMPFFLGGHPAFNCPLEDGLDFTDYQVIFDAEEETNLVRPDLDSGLLDRGQLLSLDFDGRHLPMNHSLFYKDALCFKNTRSTSACLYSKKGKHSVTVHLEDFPNLVIWSSANDGPFVALEPMLGLSTYLDESDVFEEKDQVQFLSKGEIALYSYCIRLT